jgi:hypothetical protein
MVLKIERERSREGYGIAQSGSTGTAGNSGRGAMNLGEKRKRVEVKS